MTNRHQPRPPPKLDWKPEWTFEQRQAWLHLRDQVYKLREYADGQWSNQAKLRWVSYGFTVCEHVHNWIRSARYELDDEAIAPLIADVEQLKVKAIERNIGDIFAAYERGTDIFGRPVTEEYARQLIHHLFQLIRARRVKTPIAVDDYQLEQEALAELNTLTPGVTRKYQHREDDDSGPGS